MQKEGHALSRWSELLKDASVCIYSANLRYLNPKQNNNNKQGKF